MENKDKLLKAIETCNKGITFQNLKDDESLYRIRTSIIEDIYTYSIEAKDIGVLNFRNKYAEDLKNNGKI
jgi:hypothetical protein